MKYPKHIILDLQTPSSVVLQQQWEHESKRRMRYKFGTKPLDLLRAKPRTIHTAPIKNLAKSDIFTSLTLTNFDINFIRKEKIYTKLKYSRCPQYDIVSGGFAAILAGFIGFLISEKFGLELVDSGDFYIAFMYGVFAAFSVRPLIRIYSKDDARYTPISPRYPLVFIRDLLILTLQELRLLANRLASILR